MPAIKLSNGVEMPWIGYGVFLVPPIEAWLRRGAHGGAKKKNCPRGIGGHCFK